jgi:hypothetical protein
MDYRQGLIADQIGPVEDPYPDDLLIMCSSFEERCESSLRKLRADYRCRSALIFRYSGSDRKWDEVVQTRTKSLLSNLKLVCLQNLELVTCVREDPLDGFVKFQDLLGGDQAVEGKRITIDVSAFTKEYIMLLFRLIDATKNRVRVLHTRVDYRQGRYLPLSWGVKSIASVPFYNGTHLSGQETILIAYLGYEGHRSYAVWKSCEPSRTIAVIGYSEIDPYQPGVPTRAEKSNRLLLDAGEPLVERKYVPIYDLNANIKLLKEIYEYGSLYSNNICLAPFGSKVQALAVSLFIQEIGRQTAKVHVLTARPFFYTPEYPKPPLESWQYLLF